MTDHIMMTCGTALAIGSLVAAYFEVDGDMVGLAFFVGLAMILFS